MALPPRELNTACIRCKAAMQPEERYCSSCGADRELELAVAGQLDPAIGSLRRWLAALGVISAVLGWLIYSDLRRLGLPADRALIALWPTFALAGGLLVLFFLARPFPLAASLVALLLFAGTWAYDFFRGGAASFEPNIGLALRIMFLIVLGGAVQAGWKARSLRARAAEAFPTAVARERPTSR